LPQAAYVGGQEDMIIDIAPRLLQERAAAEASGSVCIP
jgi:hypothetical protein